MAVITISRQLGSLGRVAAALVAERLGYRVVQRDVINEAARRASTPEVAISIIDELNLLNLTPTLKARKAYCQAMAQVMDELVREGNIVIIGRAGQVILRDYPGVTHVRIIAPEVVRVERVAQRLSIPLAAAQAQIQTSDRSRSVYLRRYYHVNWDDPELYDLVINTDHVLPHVAADVICQVAQDKASRVSGETSDKGGRA